MRRLYRRAVLELMFFAEDLEDRSEYPPLSQWATFKVCLVVVLATLFTVIDHFTS